MGVDIFDAIAVKGEIQVKQINCDKMASLDTIHSVEFLKGITLTEAKSIACGTIVGSQLATSASQKLAFWGTAAVVQPTAIADATDAASAITQLNDLLAKLRTIGIIAT